MNMVGKVEHGGTLGEFIQVTLGREHKNFVFVEVHLELIHRFHAVAGLQHRTDVGEPFVQSRLSLHTFIAPVGCDTAFGHFVHALGANLYFHPFVLGTQNGDVKTFVTI